MTAPIIRILTAAFLIASASAASAATGDWRIRTGASKLDDSPWVHLYSTTQYDDLIFGSVRESAELFVGCYESQTMIGIHTGDVLDPGGSILIRFGKAPVSPMDVTRSNNLQSVYFTADPVELAEKLATVNRVVARIETTNGPLTLEFATRGLTQKLEKIREACPLEWATGPVVE